MCSDDMCVRHHVGTAPMCEKICALYAERIKNRDKVGYDNLTREQKLFYDQTGLVPSTNPECMVNGEFMCTAPDCGCTTK